MKVPNRAPSSPSSRTRLPGAICRYSGFIAISLENTQGEPARSRRPSPGRSRSVGLVSLKPPRVAPAAESR